MRREEYLLMLMNSRGAPRSLDAIRLMQRPGSELLTKVDDGGGARAAAVGARKMEGKRQGKR
jgi:hypothetical protein